MNQNIRKVAAIGGVLGGFTALLYTITLYLLDENPFGKYKYMIAGVYAIFFIGSMWWFRDKMNNYRMGVRQGVMIGILLNAFASMMFISSIYLVMKLTETGEGILEIHQAQTMEMLDKAREFAPEKMTEKLYGQTKTTILAWDAFDVAADQIAFFLGAGFVNAIVFGLMMSFKGNEG
ncbi:MAG: hypothetical protein ACI85I_000387 [Arenicella sp.]|jgi:hypothetical protein